MDVWKILSTFWYYLYPIVILTSLCLWGWSYFSRENANGWIANYSKYFVGITGLAFTLYILLNISLTTTAKGIGLLIVGFYYWYYYVAIIIFVFSLFAATVLNRRNTPPAQ